MTIRIVHLLAAMTCVCAFNIDTSSPIVRVSSVPDSTMGFGAAVTLHQSIAGPRILVGAPKAEGKDRSVPRPGAVYSCPIIGSSPCQYLELDENAVSPAFKWTSTDVDRSDQLFGQTLVSSRGNIVVCAPRFKNNNSIIIDAVNGTESRSYYAIGRCLLFDGSYKKGQMFSTDAASGADNGRLTNYLDFVRPQFGFSAALKNGEELIVGSPGYNSSGGNAFFQTFSFVMRRHKNANLNLKFYDAYPPHEGDYRGFSVAIGKFFTLVGEPDAITYAVSRPKANFVTGKVDIFKSVNQNAQRLELLASVAGDKEPGAMFGYAVAAVNMNNDQFDALIVSAPFHGSLGAENAGKIFIFLSDGKEQAFMDAEEIVGPSKGAFFGLAVASLGDIDRDGFGDIAVAAPFLGASLEGVIYVYRGSPSGIRTPASQAIKGTDLKLTSFGYALTEPLDVDDNKYPDVLVGAYLSESAVLLRTRPVVSVSVSLTAQPDSVDLDKPNCVYNEGNTTCFNLTMCMTFQVKSGADHIGSLKVMYELVLDKLRRRLITKDNNGKDKTAISGTMIVHAGNAESCRYFVVAVQDNIRDRLRGFRSIVRVKGVELLNDSSNGDFPPLHPIQDVDLPEVLLYVGVRLLCIADPCTPNLTVQFLPRTTSSITAGSSEEVVVVLKVVNLYDTSYGAQLNLSVDPSKLRFVRSHMSDPRLQCDHIPGGALCKVGYPLRSNDLAEFQISLRQVRVEGNEREIAVTAVVSSKHEEDIDNLENNEEMHSINVTSNSTLFISGGAEPSWLNIDASEVERIVSSGATNKRVERKLIHKYMFRNIGPSPVHKLDMRFWLPVFGLSNTRLLSKNITVEVENEQSSNCKSYLSVDRHELPTASPSLFPLCSGVYTCVPVDCVISQRIEAARELFVNISMNINLSNLLDHTLVHQSDASKPVEPVKSYVVATVVADYVLFSTPSRGSLTSFVLYNIDIKPCVEMWIVFLSVLGACLLLGAAIFTLYLVGFFKQYKHIKMKVTDPKVTFKPSKPNTKTPGETKSENVQSNGKGADRHKTTSEQLHNKTNSLESSRSGSKSGSLDRYRRVRRKRTNSFQSSDDEGFPMGNVELQGDPRSPKARSRPSVKDYNAAPGTNQGVGNTSPV